MYIYGILSGFSKAAPAIFLNNIMFLKAFFPMNLD